MDLLWVLNHLGTASTAEKFMAIVPYKARSSKFLLLSKSKRLMRCGYFFYKLFFLLLRTFAFIYLFMFHCHVLNNKVILTTSLAFSFVHLSYCINLRILSFFIHHVRISISGILNIPKARDNQSAEQFSKLALSLSLIGWCRDESHFIFSICRIFFSLSKKFKAIWLWPIYNLYILIMEIKLNPCSLLPQFFIFQLR